MLIVFVYSVTDVAREMFTHIPITLTTLSVGGQVARMGKKRSLLVFVYLAKRHICLHMLRSLYLLKENT